MRSNEEKNIQKQITAWLYYKKIKAWSQNNGAIPIFQNAKKSRFIRFAMDHTGQTFKGLSDIVGYLPGGRALFIEVKTQKGRLTKEQEGFLKNAEEAGCLAFVARSLDDVIHRFHLEGIK